MKTNEISNTLPFAGAPEGARPAVDVDMDLAHKPAHTMNSWFAVGHLESRGARFSYLVHLLAIGIKGFTVALDSAASVTCEDTGVYRVQSNLYTMIRSKVARSRFEVRAPSAFMGGTLDNLTIKADVEDARIDLSMKAHGHPLFNRGTGRFDMLGMDVFQYSIPALGTTGSIRIDGTDHPVSGVSWFDRQWQDQPLGPPRGRWTWMDLNLSNGWFVSLWDVVDEDGRTDSWVTVVDGRGRHIVTDLVPLAESSFDFWQSPTSGCRFPTRWLVRVPALGLELEVTAKPKWQEIVGVLHARYEGACHIRGMVGRESVSGRCYVEMVGDWKSKRAERVSLVMSRLARLG
ncbi:lipocalin family protein [Sorangium sp. So ce1036]|uniref:lipocalin family protein n=1 Tax=Sorangium sp. So ce1036 TaxID=3133328 RepID=UPI003F1054A7